MLITEREKLERFYASHRMWQGVPGIERTPGGRTFITLYSGGVSEQAGNFAIVLKSDNDRDFGEPIAAAFKEGSFRCFDSTLWIDPLGRLWFIWNVAPGEECFGAICENPDADELKWSKEFYIGRGVMLNKPTVLSSGEWLFPIALWNFTIRPWDRMPYIKVGEAPRSNVYKTVDNGKTFYYNFLDCDIASLLYMKKQMKKGTQVDAIVCFEHQIPFIQEFFSKKIHIRCFSIDTVEKILGITPEKEANVEKED